MTLMPTPHGNAGLINRTVPAGQEAEFRQKLSTCKTYLISDADLSIFYRIADGALSPLEGPMNREIFYEVLESNHFSKNSDKILWTIPIAFPVSKTECEQFKIGETVAVVNSKGDLVGKLEIEDIYRFDKDQYNQCVYGTPRKDHPGPRIFNDDPREYLLGGKIMAFQPPKHSKYLLSPQETRELFAQKHWDRVVAFQTRNALHRAHEYAMVYALETLSKQGFHTGAVLNALVGATKNDDVPAEIRMQTYEVLINQQLIGQGDIDLDFWQSRDYNFYDQVLLIALDMKMFYAGPKEAIMHAIYRQNYGFTDIIIGRKHADAPFDDGTPAWGDFDAHEIFDTLGGDLQIKPFKVGFAAFYEELNRVGLVSEFQSKGYHPVSISGKALRQKLKNSEPLDERIMRKPVADILAKFYTENPIRSKNIAWHTTGISQQDREKQNQHQAVVLWLTGLSGSGKSTIATALQAALFEKGCQVYILDGDNIRHGLNRDLGFSPEDREENIRRIGEVARLFVDAGLITITSFISPYQKDRAKARSLLAEGDFIEIYVKASLETCKKRDPKGLYQKALKGEIKEFTGISAPYEEPKHPELVIETDQLTVEECVQKILDYLNQKNVIR